MAGEKHLRLQVSGGYNGTGAPTAEVWSFNMRLALVFGDVDSLGTFPTNWEVEPNFDSHTAATFTTQKTWIAQGPTGNDFDPESWLTDQVEPAVAGFISGWKFSPRAEVRSMIVYPCKDGDGTSIEGNFARLDYTSSNPVGGGSNLMPLENSVVVSWTTSRLGPRGRGRIYTPPPGTNCLDADGLVSSGDRLDLVDAAVTFAQDLAYTGIGGSAAHVRPVVTGPTAKPGQPAYTRYALIEGVRVGRVMDTQRRRRNAEVEDYASAPVTY